MMKTMSPLKHLPLKCLVLCVSLGLAACGGDSGEEPVIDDGLDQFGDLEFSTGCDWREIFREGEQFYSLSDTAARYWYALAPTEPDAADQLHFEGRYPDARYFSLHVYDGFLLAKDARADYRLSPDFGSFNPFLDKTRKSALIAVGGSYTGTVAFTARPGLPPQNTIYRGDRVDETEPLQRQTLLIYRSYVPATQTVDLPDLVLARADGTEIDLAQTPDTEACARIDELFRAYQRGESDSVEAGDPPLAADPPRFEIYYPLDEDALPPLVYNIHIRYMSTTLEPDFGGLMLMRARAPSYTGQGGALSSPEVRFWSICANRVDNQFVDGCAVDQSTPLDEDGFFNVVVSTDEDRPANADVDNGFVWLHWKGDTELLIYRMMLAADSFAQSIDQVDPEDDPASVMGDYFPQTTYCDRDVFEASSGLSPAEVFATCQASAS